MSRADLAARAGVTRASISHVVSGARRAGPDLLTRIADALQLPEETVFRAAGILRPARDDLSPAKRRLMRLAEDADDEVVELAVAVLDAARKQRTRPRPGGPQRKTAGR